jgi:hypothetical protein
MNLTDYIKVYQQAMDEQTCSQYINQFESDHEHQLVRKEGIYNFTEINTIQAGWNLDPLYDNIITHRAQYWKDCGITQQHVKPEHGWEEIRMKRYIPGSGDEFKVHTDSWCADTAKRFLVYFWYLNTVQVGGETEFYGLDRPVRITPEAGTLIMFPASWQYLHAGLPPISNNKYIIGGYFHYG